jgi:hypothetical protein
MSASSMNAHHFATYQEFFTYYLQQHSKPRNRLLHACGTALGVAILFGGLAFGRYWLALLWIPVTYGFAWAGHFLIERNKPASWGHPWWSFISDFRMLWLMLTGELAAIEAPQKISSE